MVTMKDVAEKAKVSRATVSRVLSGHPSISPETRNNVMYWVKKLKYQPNKVAQSLAGNKTYIIGVSIPNLSNPFFSEIVNAVEAEATRVGYSIIIATHGSNLHRESNIINTFFMRRVDAIIAIPVDYAASKKALMRFEIPIISVTKKFENLDSVLVSHDKGVEEIVKHFVSLGHYNIGYIGRLASEKFLYLQQSAKILGATITQVIELKTSVAIDESSTVTSSIKETGLNCTAIFAHNDIAACDAIRSLNSLAYHVPKDVVVAGFDNTILASKMDPQLTSIAQPTAEIGKYCVDIAVDKINGLAAEVAQIEVEPRLVVRASTASSILK